MCADVSGVAPQPRCDAVLQLYNQMHTRSCLHMCTVVLIINAWGSMVVAAGWLYRMQAHPDQRDVVAPKGLYCYTTAPSDKERVAILPTTGGWLRAGFMQSDGVPQRSACCHAASTCQTPSTAVSAAQHNLQCPAWQFCQGPWCLTAMHVFASIPRV